MNISDKPTVLQGIIPPMVTPLLDANTLDESGVERLVEHLISGGVNGIFILGTTGEAQHVCFDVKKALIRKTAACIGGRVPLLVGATDTSLTDSLKIAQIAADNNASAIVAAPPYFFALGQSELVDYYKSLADQSPVPVFLYNMPSHTKTMIEIDTVTVLAQHKNVIGIKDSSANGVYFCKLIHLFRDRPEFRMFVGPEEMMPAMVLMGAHGGIPGGGNVYPEIFVQTYKAAAAKDVHKTLELCQRMMVISKELYGLGTYSASYIKGIKTALSLKGICNDLLTPPFNRFQESEIDKVRIAVEKLDKMFT